MAKTATRVAATLAMATASTRPLLDGWAAGSVFAVGCLETAAWTLDGLGSVDAAAGTVAGPGWVGAVAEAVAVGSGLAGAACAAAS
jgi:hypothetical protein